MRWLDGDGLVVGVVLLNSRTRHRPAVDLVPAEPGNCIVRFCLQAWGEAYVPHGLTWILFFFYFGNTSFEKVCKTLLPCTCIIGVTVALFVFSIWGSDALFASLGYVP
jgi:hypothetical protein